MHQRKENELATDRATFNRQRSKLSRHPVQNQFKKEVIQPMASNDQIRQLALHELAAIAFSKPIIKGGPLYKTRNGLVIYKAEKLKAVYAILKETKRH